MSKLDRKTTKQMTVIFKIGYTEMNVGVSPCEMAFGIPRNS